MQPNNKESRIPNSRRLSENPESKFQEGFTLLEILVALAILGIAIAVVLQLFSANLRAISASEDYVAAVTKAESKMREVLDDEKLEEKTWKEVTEDGYSVEVTISRALEERTEKLQMRLLEVNLILRWSMGLKEKSLNLKTLKVVNKQV